MRVLFHLRISASIVVASWSFLAGPSFLAFLPSLRRSAQRMRFQNVSLITASIASDRLQAVAIAKDLDNNRS